MKHLAPAVSERDRSRRSLALGPTEKQVAFPGYISVKCLDPDVYVEAAWEPHLT